MAHPIWKDCFVDLGTDSSIEYRIRVNGTSGPIIYRGKAYLRPDANSIRVRINDICADYMRNVLPDMADRDVVDTGTFKKFWVQKLSDDGVWHSVSSVEFIYDWSYDYDYNPETMGMAFPITGRMDLRQLLIFSVYDQQTATATIHLKDGSSFNVYVPIEVTADFNNDYNNDYAISLMRAFTTGTFALSLDKWPNVDRVTIGHNTYQVAGSCYQYALYYLNAYGGWDFLLVEGNHKEADNLTRRTMQQEFDNNDVFARGKRNYLNEIVKTYTLQTGWLLDHESARMHHLLNSTEVFLMDIPSGRLMPVVLTNTTTDYKRFRTNGNRMVNYEITAELSQDRIRR